MANQVKPEDAQSFLTSLHVGDEIIRDRLLAAKEELIQEGVITESTGERFERKLAEKPDLGIRIKVPRDLLSARLVRVEQMDDFTWTNTLFEILLALDTCFLGAFLGYLTSTFRFDSIVVLLLTFSAILTGLTIYLLSRRKALMKDIVQEENFISLVETGLGLDLTRPKT